MRNLNLVSLNNFVSALGAYYGEYGIPFIGLPKLPHVIYTEACMTYTVSNWIFIICNLLQYAMPSSNIAIINLKCIHPHNNK